MSPDSNSINQNKNAPAPTLDNGDTGNDIPPVTNNKELIDWSKWMIGINFSAATGCVIAFNTIKPHFFFPGCLFALAILLFVANVFAAITFTFRLATGVYTNYRKWGKLQIWLFIAGVLSLLAWVAVPILKNSNNQQTIQTTTKDTTTTGIDKAKP